MLADLMHAQLTPMVSLKGLCGLRVGSLAGQLHRVDAAASLSATLQRSLSTTAVRCVPRDVLHQREADWSPLSYERRRDSRQAVAACPACGQPIFRFETLARHLARCCSDLVLPQALQAVEDDLPALQRLLAAARAREVELQDMALQVAFRSRDADGQPLRKGSLEVAQQLGLPPVRAERLLRAAMRAVPLVADEEPVQVLFEDEHLIAVNKPPDVITAPRHRYTGGSMVNRLIHYLRGAEPRVCHRLDMHTSGVVLFAKTRAAAAHIHAQFRERVVVKRYVALCAGVVDAGSRFLVDAPIGRHPDEKVARMVCADGQASTTDIWGLATMRDADLAGLGATPSALMSTPELCRSRAASLVCAAPRTGRTHQIRVHLAHVGCPILGDDVYGVMLPCAPRQALHAAAMQVVHPATLQPLRLTAPLPEDFQSTLSVLKLHAPPLDALCELEPCGK